MANFRGAAHLAAAMRAVLAQTEDRLQLIVADDASDDDSVAIARAIAAQDGRVHVIASPRNGGPAATRNLGLEAATGDWIAIVDSDDLIHPQRFARLIAAAEAEGADLVADDLVHFGAAEQAGGRTLLMPMALDRPMPLTVATYLRGSTDALPSFGYLKPMIRRRVLGGLRYDTRLKIGEDQDLVLRLLAGGARFLLLPDPLYAYRRHGGSVSHRLSVETAAAMLAAHEGLPPLTDPEARRVAAAVHRRLRRTLRYERLVADLKARRWAAALPRLADPAMIARLADSLRDRRRRSVAHGPEAEVPMPPLPQMPPPGAPWPQPPAAAAAWIAAHPTALPDTAPDWAQWLAAAVRGDSA